MTGTRIHPAIPRLLHLQCRGRGRRMWQRFRQRRRLLLSAVACILAVIWLGNAILTILFREASSADTLRALLSFGLVAYAGWHFAKAAFFPVEAPLDGPPEEREALAVMPLRPCDLVHYQLGSVALTTLLKGSVLTILLLPDLRCLPLGLLGLMLAMTYLELLRMAIDITVWGMNRRTYLAYRTIVVATLTVAGIAVGLVVAREGAAGPRINFGEGFLQRLLEITIHVHDTVFAVAGQVFRPVIELIVADGMSGRCLGLAAVAVAGVVVSAAALIRLYARTRVRVAERMQTGYDPSWQHDSCPDARVGGTHVGKLPEVVRWRGAGVLAWRQMVGARRRWGSLLAAMIAPAILACAPCLLVANPAIAFLATTGALAFYTFLLLPTALRFDFRRDLDRFAMLKSLPIGPFAVAFGQILTPVIIATAFQAVVLAFAIASRSLPSDYYLAALVILVPLNVLVFVLDNLIFMLYPYRVQQEGLEVFFRTMLTFTGKGVLFMLALGVIVFWVFAATALTQTLSQWTGRPIPVAIIFGGGMVLGPSLLAAWLTFVLGQAFRRLDAEDIPR